MKWLTLLLLAIGACGAPPSSNADPRAPVSWSALSSRLDQTCGLDADGTPFCWGSGWLGSTAPRDVCAATVDPVTGLGGERACAKRPVQVGAGPFTRLALGENGAFGLGLDGVLWVWGLNQNQSLGFTNSGSTSPDQYLSALRSPIADTLKLSAVAAAADGACGITTDRRLFCWGMPGPRTGSLAAPACDDPALCGVAPQQIGPLIRKWTDVTVGAAHACALDSGGSVGCWGRGDRGQLGYPPAHTCTQGDASYPCEIRPGSTVLNRFLRVAAAGDLTCGLTGLDGPLICWGSPALALPGRYTDFAVSPTEVCGLTDGGNVIACAGTGGMTAGLVSAGGTSALGETAVALTMGQGFACARTRDGVAYCAGTQILGHLGDGRDDPGVFRSTPVPVSAPYRD